jgi:hypothetical protein
MNLIMSSDDGANRQQKCWTVPTCTEDVSYLMFLRVLLILQEAFFLYEIDDHGQELLDGFYNIQLFSVGFYLRWWHRSSK